jgi:hypothetical protein
MDIKMYEFGRDILRSSRSYDFALMALFANAAALERYQNHTEHLPVIAKVKAMCENVVTVDFTARMPARRRPAPQPGSGSL